MLSLLLSVHLDVYKLTLISLTGDVTYLTMNAQNYDVSLHRRIPNIIDHNNLVYDTFMMTASMLEEMG